MDARVAAAVFFPRPDQPFGPDAPGAFDHLFDITQGVRMRLRVFPAPPDAPAVLFFHGNGETARDYDPIAPAFTGLPAWLLIGEYRGYGPSTGAPSLDTFLADALASLDEALGLLRAAGQAGPLIVMGRSLGSAAAIEIAHSRAEQVDGLIVESAFARIVPLLELIGVPARRLGISEQDGPRNLDKMADIDLPTLILHAEQDEIIPVGEAELLYGACRDPDKQFQRVPGAGHNDIQYKAGPAYFERVRALIERAADSARGHRKNDS